MIIRFPRGDQANHLASAAIAMAYRQQVALIRTSQQIEALFAFGMRSVRQKLSIVILKSRGRFREADAVLAQVGLGFSGIPFEA
ncbi:hypothetical protein ACZ75_26040 [Massilia sp. NR 4-1]|nr:hypothetical protein ACZ75_26040 [Massilia sp. NR 4-1]